MLTNMRLTSIWEFVIATFLVGNDFLPPIPGVDNIYDYIPLLTQIT
jgi:5'-3' exonuclease